MNIPNEILQLTSDKLERIFRELESTDDLPESVNKSAHDLVDMVIFLYRNGKIQPGAKKSKQTFTHLASLIYQGNKRSREHFNTTFMARRRSNGDVYRKVPSPIEMEKFLKAILSVWNNEWSPQHYNPPIDVEKVIENTVCAYRKKPWENIAILINLLHGVEWITLDDIRYLTEKRVQYNDDTTLEIIQIILEERS